MIARRSRLPWAVALLLLPCGCRIGAVEPTPLRGNAPRVVAIWPLVAEPFMARRDVLLATAGDAIRRRGYQPITAAVAEQMLFDAGLSPLDDDLTRCGQQLGADALLQCEVRRFEADVGRPLRSAVWDIRWRLVSTRGLGEQWSFEHHGSWRARDADRVSPLRRLDAEPDIVPIGGMGAPDFRDAAELMAWLHRLAMEHLPEAAR